MGGGTYRGGVGAVPQGLEACKDKGEVSRLSVYWRTLCLVEAAPFCLVTEVLGSPSAAHVASRCRSCILF